MSRKYLVAVARAEAPGRVNLIGEHTDYNDGLVLPATIPLRVAVELSPPPDASDALVTATSQGFAPLTYALAAESRAGDWGDHVRGVTWALRSAGHRVSGFACHITSDIPPGAGLASSAALAVALLRALREAFDLALDDRAIALLAHRAEHDFVGARVGRMDQLAASLGRAGEALFIDTRSLEVDRIALPPELALVVIDSGVPHRHASGGYNTRRAECEEAARLLDVPALRDATLAGLARLERHPLLAKRAQHVITENERVRSFVAALRARDLAACGALINESHRSLRDEFEVSTPEIDALVDLLRAQGGVLGAHIVGGGFGGSVLAIADPASARSAADAACTAFRDRGSSTARVLLPVG